MKAWEVIPSWIRIHDKHVPWSMPLSPKSTLAATNLSSLWLVSSICSIDLKQLDLNHGSFTAWIWWWMNRYHLEPQRHRAAWYNEWVSAAKVNLNCLDGLHTPGNIYDGDGNDPVPLACPWGLSCHGCYGVQCNSRWGMHKVLLSSPMVCILPQWVDTPVETKKSVKS